MEKEKTKVGNEKAIKQAEDFLKIINECTPAQKQYFAGVLDGMKYSTATDDSRTA